MQAMPRQFEDALVPFFSARPTPGASFFPLCAGICPCGWVGNLRPGLWSFRCKNQKVRKKRGFAENCNYNEVKGIYFINQYPGSLVMRLEMRRL